MSIFSGALFRLFQLGRESLWYDELYTVWSSRLPLGSLVQEEAAAMHPPVYYLLGHFWFSLFPGDTGVRLISWAAGVAIIYLTYLTGKELFSRSVGLWAAALAAISPFLIWSSREATYYSWVTFISLLSFYLLLRAINSGGGLRWLGYSIVTSLVLFSYFFSPVLLAAQLGVFLLLRNKSRISWPFAASLSVLFLFETVAMVALALVYLQPGMVGFTALPSFIPRLVGDLAVSPYVFVQGTPGSTMTSDRMLLLITVVLTLGLALISSSKLRNIFRDRRLNVLALYTLSLVLGMVVLHSLSADTSGTFRLYSWAAPTFVILIAVLIDAIPQKIRLQAGAVLISAIIIFTVVPVLKLKTWDMRGVMKIVATNQQSGDGLLCFPLHHCVVAASQYPPGLAPIGGFISDNNVHLSGGGWNGYRIIQPAEVSLLSGNELRVALRKALSGKTRVWIVAGNGAAKEEYPKADSVYKELTGEWKEMESWDIPPYCLKLFVR